MNCKLSNTQIRDLFLAGSRQTEISKLAGVSRQRIQQILRTNFGLTRLDCPYHTRETQHQRKRRLYEEACQRRWQMSVSERDGIRQRFGHKPFEAFWNQRTNASKRGIPFNFTFRSWWDLWQESGRWSERGRSEDGKRHGYVMSRVGDRGPYQPDNVRIVTQSENMFEYHALRKGMPPSFQGADKSSDGVSC